MRMRERRSVYFFLRQYELHQVLRVSSQFRLLCRNTPKVILQIYGRKSRKSKLGFEMMIDVHFIALSLIGWSV